MGNCVFIPNSKSQSGSFCHIHFLLGYLAAAHSTSSDSSLIPIRSLTDLFYHNITGVSKFDVQY